MDHWQVYTHWDDCPLGNLYGALGACQLGSGNGRICTRARINT